MEMIAGTVNGMVLCWRRGYTYLIRVACPDGEVEAYRCYVTLVQ